MSTKTYPCSSRRSPYSTCTGVTFPSENKRGKRMGNRRNARPMPRWLWAIDGQHVRPLLTPIKMICTTWREVFPQCRWFELALYLICRCGTCLLPNIRLRKFLENGETQPSWISTPVVLTDKTFNHTLFQFQILVCVGKEMWWSRAHLGLDFKWDECVLCESFQCACVYLAWLV